MSHDRGQGGRGDPMRPVDPMEGRFCGARNRNGEPCEQPAGAGTDHLGAGRCYFHGGNAPGGRLQGARQLAEREVRRRMALTDADPLTDPYGTLERIGGIAAQLVEELTGAVDRLNGQYRYAGGLGAGVEQVRGELTMLLAALRQAESIAGRMIALDLDSRRLRLQEAQVAAVVTALGHVLDRIGLDEVAQRKARALLANELAPAAVRKPLEAPPDVPSDQPGREGRVTGHPTPRDESEDR